MRRFVEAFRHHLAAAGAPTDAETVWRLLRRFQILAFDFEAPRSAYENVVRERARMALADDQLHRAGELWLVLADEAQARGTAGGDADRTSLLERLLKQYGFRFDTQRDLLSVRRKLSSASAQALDDIRDQVGGIRLARADTVEACHQALETGRLLVIQAGAGFGKSAILKRFAVDLGAVVVLAPGRIIGGGWIKMALAIGCEASLDGRCRAQRPPILRSQQRARIRLWIAEGRASRGSRPDRHTRMCMPISWQLSVALAPVG